MTPANNHTKQIIDQFGRVHDYLRISLTERCNLRCFYCMPEEGIQLRDRAEFMRTEELLYIAKTFVDLGVKKIRLTGGEPLIKKDAQKILEELGKLPVELAITTNAVLVDKFIDVFKTAGIKSVNVSLDSLKHDRINKFSRRNFADKIIDNIDLLINEGFKTKVNVVAMKNENDDEIIDFIEWTKGRNAAIRFIEFMPFSGNKWHWDKKISYKEILEIVDNHYDKNKIIKIEDHKNDTSKNYRIEGYKGSFGIISPVTNPFCDTCNRIRLTADGKIKNCLFSPDESDLLTNLRNGNDIVPIITNTILNKKKERAGINSFNDKLGKEVFLKNRSMTTIGG